MRGDGPQAVVVGASSMIGRHLLRRLTERGVAGQCLTRRAVPAPQELPPGFSWSVLSGDGEVPVPPDAALFSLAPIAVLPPLIARMTGGRRLVALSTASAIHKADSSDPAERARTDEVRRAESEVGHLCRERGIAWTILRADPDLRPRARPQCQRHRRRRETLPLRSRRLARQRSPPADPCRRRGAGHGRRPRRAGRGRRDTRPSRRRDIDLPRHGPPDFRGPGAAPCPALPAARTPADGLQGMEDGDGRGLQPRNAGADEQGPDLRSGSRAREILGMTCRPFHPEFPE